MPELTLQGGPLDGTTFDVPDAEWPTRMVRFDEGVYYADADTLVATYVDPTVGTGDDGGDPLEYPPGPPGDQGPAGVEGPAGPAGADGADAVAIGLTPQGTWTAETGYVAYDHVIHDGSSYYATSDPAVGLEPPLDPWTLLAAAGAPGEAGGGGTGTMSWEGAWVAGTYAAGAVVNHADHLWIALVETTQEPAEAGGGGGTPGYEDPPTALSGTMPSQWLVPDDPTTVTVDGSEGGSGYWTGSSGTPGRYVAFDVQPDTAFEVLIEQIGGSGTVPVHVGRTAPAADADTYGGTRNIGIGGSSVYSNSEAGNTARYVFVVTLPSTIRFTLTVTSGETLPSSLGGGADPEWELML